MPVVLLKRTDQQVTHRVLAKIGRYVGDTDLAGSGDLAAGARVRTRSDCSQVAARCILAADEFARALQLQIQGIRQQQ